MFNSVIVALSLYSAATIVEPQKFSVDCTVNDYVYNTSGYMTVVYWTDGQTEIIQYDSKGENVNNVLVSNDMTYCENKGNNVQCITDVVDGERGDELFFVVEMNKLDSTGVYALVSKSGDMEKEKTPDDGLLQTGTCEIVK